MVLLKGVNREGTDIMIKGQVKPLYLLIFILLLLSSCGAPEVITLPPDEPTAVQVNIEQPTDTPEAEPETAETTLEDLLAAGTAMKWYDEGYIVFVPAGEVTLGDNDYENNPVHSVMVEDFWIYMFKVTNGQYRQCVATGACTAPAGEEGYPDLNNPAIKDKPVIGVSWEQANTYCEWMNGRLPSNAEWEKAARGPEAYTYPWGEVEPNCDLVNYGECEDPEITKVYEYPDGRSFYQAFDLAGNTFEWAYDQYELEIIAQLPEEEPAGTPEGTERSVRGSDYEALEDMVPSALLYYLEPEGYRPDLGFRCVLQGAEPKTFGSPCIQTAYVPGLPAPWVPGPPPPGDPQLPDFDPGPCYTDIGTSFTTYCSNAAQKQGGLDLNIAALGADDVYVKSWTSNQGVACINGSDPFACFGPEGASVIIEICATCTPAPVIETADFYCENCYVLEHSNPPTCVYTGSPVPGGACPAGYVYDPVGDICVQLGFPSQECPKGYWYDADKKCCVASFAQPSPDAPGATATYLPCPPGFGNVVFTGSDSVQPNDYATCYYDVYGVEQENCITQEFKMGFCPRCVNPSSYTNKTSCEAAFCKWASSPTGAPDFCTFP